ncbi:nonstructural protein [Microviridae sp.]|nr:nonstructural protein [Microviridae sp.]
MKTILCSIFDIKSGVYTAPSAFMNDATAIRSATILRADPASPMYAHPEDYVLYKIGEFENTDCSITMETPPIPLGKFIEFKVPAAPTAVDPKNENDPRLEEAKS